MFQEILNQLQIWLGLEQEIKNVGALQMALRTVIIYIISLAIIRFGSKRFLSEATAFDVIVGIMLGSVMSRAINGSAPLFPTLIAGAALVAIHWLIARIAYHSDWFGALTKGKPTLLIKDGEVRQQAMREAGLSKLDLEQALRMGNNRTDPAKIKLAYLERNGDISVIPSKSEPRVLDVAVRDGVQIVRIELE